MTTTERLDLIINYEMGMLSQEKTLELFGELVKTGLAWSLQGHYGRTAHALIEAGWISRSGEVSSDMEEYEEAL